MLGCMEKTKLHLSKVERQELEQIVSSGNSPARKIRRAQIMLRLADGWTIAGIAAALGVSRQTVHVVRNEALAEGVRNVLSHRSGRKVGQVPKSLDGAAEARLIALTCSEPPSGRERWTLRLLAGRRVELGYVPAVSHETVRQVLKKTNSSRGASKPGTSRRRKTRRL
jgi:transposase